jgi:hypothetical protein
MEPPTPISQPTHPSNLHCSLKANNCIRVYHHELLLPLLHMLVVPFKG